MPRVVEVLTPGGECRPAETLLLTYDQRRLQHGFVFGSKGTCVELDFAEPVRLATDDVLRLDDGTLVEVVADVEPLVEVRLADAAALAHLAWKLGDRHVPAQIFANRLRVRRTPEIEAFLAEAGGKISVIVAPFEPDREAEPQAHDHGRAHHDHEHHHRHDHDHR